MKTAERLNHDQFDLLCRACDAGGLTTLAELSEVLEGEANKLPRASQAVHHLILLGFVERSEGLYRITEAGRFALS